ncbi:MAG: DUF362 domain-containing protein [Clostridia bacterium]|nr:DUF362 domain-containing protein [Clostridia bacterium]
MESTAKKQPVIRLRPFSEVWIGTGNGLLKKNLKRGLDALGGLKKFIKPGQSVFIKPNLTAAQEEITGGVTDLRMCRALIELIQEETEHGHLMVGENTGQGGVIGRYFISHGWAKMCEDMGVELVDFEKDEWGEYPLPDAMFLDVVHLPKKVVEADVYITLPILKNHDTVCITAAIKNSFGLISMIDRRETHRANAIEQCIVDIARIRKPDLCIVDGRIGMEGIAGGSHFDHPRYANRIIIGADPVAVDVVCTHIMEQNPRVRYLQWAEEYGIGNANLDYISIKGMPLEEAKVPFMTPAEEIEETTGGKIHLYDLDSCSRCRAVAQGTLHRFRSPESVLNEVDILYGPGDWNIDEKDRSKACILVGDCIQEKYRSLGRWVPGCPMNEAAYFSALNDLNVVCNRCELAVREWMATHTEEELAFLRILASNKTVFQGKDNHSEATDYVLTVGDCQMMYARHHKFRSMSEFRAKGLDINIDDLVATIPGHVPTMETIEEAYQKLKAHHDANAK